jgi:hypothetical protein
MSFGCFTDGMEISAWTIYGDWTLPMPHGLGWEEAMILTPIILPVMREGLVYFQI